MEIQVRTDHSQKTFWESLSEWYRGTADKVNSIFSSVASRLSNLFSWFNLKNLLGKVIEVTSYGAIITTCISAILSFVLPLPFVLALLKISAIITVILFSATLAKNKLDKNTVDAVRKRIIQGFDMCEKKLAEIEAQNEHTRSIADTLLARLIEGILKLKENILGQLSKKEMTEIKG